MDVQQLVQQRKQNTMICLIDIRERHELELATLNYDLHIPIGELYQHLDELPQDKRLVLYCHHGRRSHIAALQLVEWGIEAERVYSLTGGIDMWSQQIDVSVPRY